MMQSFHQILSHKKLLLKNNDVSEKLDNEKQEPLLLEIQSFLNAIEGKSEHIVTAQQAVNVTKIAVALLSSQKGTNLSGIKMNKTMLDILACPICKYHPLVIRIKAKTNSF